MRNIHIFVRLHRYNLNQQLFVEGDSEAKYLSTIGIKHIAASIRTHGLGVMSTTVNFTYQLLKQKLFVCSQFLFDDHIKSRLIKDARYFRQEREAVGNRYPFDRAERFVRDVRKLGVSAAGLSVLDRFRQLVTEIGNAMGYVRMVRAGGLHYAATALGCAPGTVELPDLNALAAEARGEVEAQGEAARHPPPTATFDSAEAAPAAREASPLTPHSADAAANLARVLERTRASFEEGATYFHKLESVFAEEMRSPKNSHLQTFFILVPALTINFVEHLLAAKDKLQRGQLGAAFTDDGFAMGLAYLLNLLAQARRTPPDPPRPDVPSAHIPSAECALGPVERFCTLFLNPNPSPPPQPARAEHRLRGAPLVRVRQGQVRGRAQAACRAARQARAPRLQG
jgi:WASH complex subunit 7